MINFYDYKKDDSIKDDSIAEIEYIKGLYEAQVHKVEQEKYIKDLLFADYVRKVKSRQSRYDYIKDIFNIAQGQIEKKKKKEREQLSIIENFVKEDFLSNCHLFKITNLICGGYEGYCWNVEFEGFGQTFYISIPIMDNINTQNIQYANDGMFAFIIRESSFATSVKKKSYKIEDISEFIKEYFTLDELCEVESQSISNIINK